MYSINRARGRTSRRLSAVVLFATAGLLAGCNSGASSAVTYTSGGGTPSTSSPPASSAVTYTSSAGAGELLTYTLDTTNLTYSYRITNSSYGLQGVSGSGTLTANGKGTYTPVGMPNVRVLPTPNGMLVGAVKLTINGTQQVVPLIGVQHPVTTFAAIAGDYNYVGGGCTDSSRTNCSAAYGTVHIDSNGTWASCTLADYTVDPVNCSGNPRYTGTLNSLGNGEWQVLLSSGVQVGTGIGFQAPNGQKVWILDLSQPTAKGGLGLGLDVGSTRVAMGQTVAQGTWVYAGATASGGYAGSLTVTGTSYSFGQFGGSPFGPFTLTFNAPWAGFATSTNGAVALLAGTGVYAAENIGAMEVGLRR